MSATAFNVILWFLGLFVGISLYTAILAFGGVKYSEPLEPELLIESKDGVSDTTYIYKIR